jgi:ATP phosphoribosyltransferase regulatory subunit HisZ
MTNPLPKHLHIQRQIEHCPRAINNLLNSTSSFQFIDFLQFLSPIQAMKAIAFSPTLSASFCQRFDLCKPLGRKQNDMNTKRSTISNYLWHIYSKSPDLEHRSQ